MLWAIVIVVSVVLLVLSCLLFAPFYIYIDSVREVYGLRFQRLVSVYFVTSPSPALDVKIAWWRHSVLLKGGRGTLPYPAPAGSSRTIPYSLQKVFAVIRSFRVKQCFINIDTGNMQLNGLLYPLLIWLTWRSRKQVQINFTGETEVVVKLQNNLARMAWAWLSSKA